MRWLLVLALLGCGSSETAEETPTPEPTPPGPVVNEEPETPPEPPQSPPVNLLEAAGIDIAVSSAYRDRESEIPKLFDGDLETAWNSKTDDLQGAWIDVRVPDDASVTSIDMTAGYTKTDSRGTDLFTGNHRIARVRISHGGQELTTHALDTSSREIQSIPVTGPGGVYRIEILEVTPGERDDWKEACISELRVMGRVPEPEEGRFPRVAIGSLPDAWTAPAAPDANALRLATHRFADAWGEYEYETLPSDLSSGDPGLEGWELEEATSQRRRALTPLVDLFASKSAAHSDQIRRLLATRVSSSWWADHRAELDVIAAGFDALVEGDQEATCRWAKAHAHLRIGRIFRLLEREEEIALQDETDDDFSDVTEAMEDATTMFKEDAQTTTARVLRLGRPSATSVHADWDAMRPSLELAQRTCGWN